MNGQFHFTQTSDREKSSSGFLFFFGTLSVTTISSVESPGLIMSREGEVRKINSFTHMSVIV